MWRCVGLVLTDVSEERWHPPANASASLANFATLKMDAIRSSETLVNTRPTQRHIPEDDILQHEDSFYYSLSVVSDDLISGSDMPPADRPYHKHPANCSSGCL
jgi:hypothetical protein